VIFVLGLLLQCLDDVLKCVLPLIFFPPLA
jgi:hypothetical protein